MKKYISFLLVFLIIPFFTIAQEEKNKDEEEVQKEVVDKPERSAFESSFIIDNPTNIVYQKKTLEAQMNHRFGIIDFDNDDLLGIWGNANIRLGVVYGIHDRINIGFGAQKFRRYLDLNWKVALLQQTRSGKMPISLTYYGNFAYDARKQGPSNIPPINYAQDRYTYFNQLIVAHRFSPEFSLEATASYSHYNTVYQEMNNDVFAMSVGGRYKISPQTSILIDYSQPFTSFKGRDPKPGFSLGFEFGTSAHAFQIFATNYWGILPQENYVWNQNDFFDGDIMLGFNITRLYNF